MQTPSRNRPLLSKIAGLAEQDLPIDEILQGDCRQILPHLPANSVDLIFADPPYNLQLAKDLYRPDMSRVDAVNDHWDQFSSFEAYDQFTTDWMTACRRVLKPTGTLWVIGSYHNIYRVGRILMDLGYWLLNDIVWIKTNPMPNFRGVRFTNAHETLLWAKKSSKQKHYTFHYKMMKALNSEKQMRSDWLIPLCTGNERLRINGDKAHTTQKPEALLERVIRASSSRGDIVLDPFFGTGTTGAVCKRFGRHFIGIETELNYIEVARKRIAGIRPLPIDDFEEKHTAPPPSRVAFTVLLERGLIQPGEVLTFDHSDIQAVVRSDGKLCMGNKTGSIHGMGALAAGTPACNGWEHWFYKDALTNQLQPINCLRSMVRSMPLTAPDTHQIGNE